MLYSLVITIKNELTRSNEFDVFDTWISSIMKQTRVPDEIIIVDGGSTDNTWPAIQKMANNHPTLKVFQYQSNIAAGRNFGIKKASGNVIVVTDAGCAYNHDWFERITAPFEDSAVQAAATAFGPWLGPLEPLRAFVLAAATTPAPWEFQRDWLPSSRSVAFRKELWETVGGYPEWIPFCEDVLFDKKIMAVTPFFYVRQPLVAWRQRPSLKAYFKQLYNYTRSEGHGLINTHRQLVRYGVYGGALIMLYSAVASGHYYWLGFIALGFLVYLQKFWRRYFLFVNKRKIRSANSNSAIVDSEFSKIRKIRFVLAGLLFVPGAVLLGDIAKMCGWPVGLGQRILGHVQPPRRPPSP